MSVDHTAVEPALGYLFQCRVALLKALQKLPDGEEFLVSVETLDDVLFEPKGAPMELLQVKHHVTHSGSLGDSSTDLWRTLKVWCDAERDGELPDDALLFLLTTSRVSKGSAASLLLVNRRDEAMARTKLLSKAQVSTNAKNAAAYAAFKAIGQRKQTALLARITILPAASTIEDLDDDLHKELYYATAREHLSAFVTRVEGWWYRQIVRQLSAGKSARIMSEEIHAELVDLQQQFRRDALPIDHDVLELDFDEDAYRDTLFVEQLRLIKVNWNRVLFAIRDYLRAFEQRSRWLREDLLLVGELERYERRLTEEWALAFEQMNDELPADVAEAAKQKAARAMYRWAEDTAIPIRERVTQPFVTRGSLQMLANDLRVGWHPDFMDRLRHLLEDVRGAG